MMHMSSFRVSPFFPLSRLITTHVSYHTTQQFEKYFAANSVEKGGSFYVQSKIYRAKEMLDQFIAEKKLEDKEAREKQTAGK